MKKNEKEKLSTSEILREEEIQCTVTVESDGDIDGDEIKYQTSERMVR